MKNVIQSYTDFHKSKSSGHLYPTEWLIRTLLGSYPQLDFDNSKFRNSKLLDIGFGDGRNFMLFDNCGADIHGVEISKDICDLVYKKFENQMKLELRVGRNSNIPFEDNFFDFAIASSSCYYVDEGTVFADNINEINRILRPNGWFIANFPLFNKDYPSINESFILENNEKIDDEHIVIRNDIYGLRNGYKFWAVRNKEHLIDSIGHKFKNFSFSVLLDNFYGVQINMLVVVCQKK
ncbi:MAG: class I SAM-dependent methyltransferase [Chitinophagaceae bacterium]|nr:class I SAM-dependent methyltransferase [Chitinophagaceae bacterium]